MAGLGSRFKDSGFKTEKPLIEVDDVTLIEHSVKTLGIEGTYIFVTREYESKSENEKLSGILKKICPNYKELRIKHQTSGAAETALVAEELINTDQPLIITNCDQSMDWEPQKFLEFSKKFDGAVVTYKSSNPKNSFAELNEKGEVGSIAEKVAVSDVALTGIHYWKRGKDFVDSAKDLLLNFKNLRREECFISETYNVLIRKGAKIGNYQVPKNSYTSLGTPKDLKLYNGKIKEFKTPKPKTIFCDIDGTILSHTHCFSELKSKSQKDLPGVIDKFDEWDSIGHKIILCTARKESAREMTETHLRSLGICWDKLLMGLTSGDRVLINDKLSTKNPDRAIASNVITNEGFSSINWSEIGL